MSFDLNHLRDGEQKTLNRKILHSGRKLRHKRIPKGPVVIPGYLKVLSLHGYSYNVRLSGRRITK